MPAAIKGTPNSAAATSVTIPTHAIGDLIVIWAYRDGSNTPASVPAASGTVPAWVTINGATGASTNSAISAYFVATATNHTSGTWTNATGMVAAVITGHNQTQPIGANGKTHGTGRNTAVTPAITQRCLSTTALLLEFFGVRNVTAWGAANTGYTLQTSVATEVCFDTKNDATTDGQYTRTNVTNASSGSGYAGEQIEILPETPRKPTIDHMNPAFL